MATVLIGPVNSLGYPFDDHNHEIVRERRIGKHLVYSFGRPYIYSDYHIEPAEPLDAVIAWDPGWYQNGNMEGARNEAAQLKNVAMHHNVPLIGMYCDWFAGWENGSATLGVRQSWPYMDGILTDPCGAAAFRTIKALANAAPGELQYRPTEELATYLSYGRLPTLGSDREAVWGVLQNYPTEQRSIDVSFIGYPHPQSVILRPYLLERLQEICDARGLSYHVAYGVGRHEMEEILLKTKVAFNLSVGSSLNMRVYEAAAAGCVLMSDDWNQQFKQIKDFSWPYHDEAQIALGINYLLTWKEAEKQRRAMQEIAIHFALRNDPLTTWERIIDAAVRCKERMGDEWERRPETSVIQAVTKEDVRKIKRSQVELI